jgi:hypothetical protein
VAQAETDVLTRPQRAALECLAGGEWHYCWKRSTDAEGHRRVNTTAALRLAGRGLARYMPDRYSVYVAGTAQITSAGRALLARRRTDGA